LVYTVTPHSSTRFGLKEATHWVSRLVQLSTLVWIGLVTFTGPATAFLLRGYALLRLHPTHLCRLFTGCLHTFRTRYPTRVPGCLLVYTHGLRAPHAHALHTHCHCALPRAHTHAPSPPHTATPHYTLHHTTTRGSATFATTGSHTPHARHHTRTAPPAHAGFGHCCLLHLPAAHTARFTHAGLHRTLRTPHTTPHAPRVHAFGCVATPPTHTVPATHYHPARYRLHAHTHAVLVHGSG